MTFSQRPLFNFSLLSWEPSSNILLLHQNFCKKLSRSKYCAVHFQSRWIFFLFVAVAKWNIWCLVEKMHCFLMLPTLHWQKGPNRHLLVEIYLRLFSPPSFPDPPTGTYHSDINVILGQGTHNGLMWCTKLSSGILPLDIMLNTPNTIFIFC